MKSEASSNPGHGERLPWGSGVWAGLAMCPEQRGLGRALRPQHSPHRGREVGEQRSHIDVLKHHRLTTHPDRLGQGVDCGYKVHLRAGAS